jgi:hypothetical protein
VGFEPSLALELIHLTTMPRNFQQLAAHHSLVLLGKSVLTTVRPTSDSMAHVPGTTVVCISQLTVFSKMQGRRH